jgi:hypothetical protein
MDDKKIADLAGACRQQTIKEPTFCTPYFVVASPRAIYSHVHYTRSGSIPRKKFLSRYGAKTCECAPAGRKMVVPKRPAAAARPQPQAEVVFLAGFDRPRFLVEHISRI